MVHLPIERDEIVERELIGVAVSACLSDGGVAFSAGLFSGAALASFSVSGGGGLGNWTSHLCSV